MFFVCVIVRVSVCVCVCVFDCLFDCSLCFVMMNLSTYSPDRTLLVRHYRVYYPVRVHLIQHMVSAMQRLGFTANVSMVTKA